MKRKTTLGLGCLLLVACKDELPANAPTFRVESAASARSDSFFCSFEDDPLEFTLPLDSVEPITLSTDPAVCLRFTVLKTDGTPVTDTARDSSCSIKPQAALGAEGGQLALSLKSTDVEGGVIDPAQQYLIRTDLFKNGALVETGLVGSFALDEEPLVDAEGKIIPTKRALTLMDHDQLSCVIPKDFAAGATPSNAGAVEDRSAALLDSRGFHAASLVGDYTAGETEGVLVSGGVTELRENVGAAGVENQLVTSIEVFNRTEMRYVPQGANLNETDDDDVKLSVGRAFHQSFTLPTNEEQIQVVLVGGTTSIDGLGRKHELFANAGNGIQNPFPVLPLTFFPAGDAAGSFASLGDLGAELVTLDKKLTPLSSEPLVDVPARFGAASIRVGAQVLSFGGIATNTLQDPDANGVDNCEDFLTSGKTLTDFLCNNGFVVERGITNQAENFETTVSEVSMGVARVGASVVDVDGDPDTATFLLMGGALAPDGSAPDPLKIAQLVDFDEAANTFTYTDLTINGIDPNLINRTFFGLARLPVTDANGNSLFALFGGDRIDPAASGNLIDDTVDPTVLGVPNIAALLTLNGTSLDVVSVNGPSIDVPLTRPSSAAALLPFPRFDPFTYLDSDIADEDQLAPLPQNLCGNPNVLCPNSNRGERLAYPMVAPGPDNSILFAGGIRGEFFPQDAILQFFIDENGLPVLQEVPNQADPNCNGGPCGLHLFRRVVGGAAVALPDRGTGKTVMFIGGIEGAAEPIESAFDLAFVDKPDRDNADNLAARRDTSFFLFDVDPQVGEIFDACDGNPEDEEKLFTESDACGFANSSLKPRRLFFVEVGGK